MSWADLITEESGTLRAQNLGAAVCADGTNGLVAEVISAMGRRTMSDVSGGKRWWIR